MDKCGVDVNMNLLLLYYKHLLRSQGAQGNDVLLFNVELTPLKWPTNHTFDNKTRINSLQQLASLLKKKIVGLPIIMQVFVTFERVCTHLYVCDT